MQQERIYTRNHASVQSGPKLHMGREVSSWQGGFKVRIKDDVRKCVVFLGLNMADENDNIVPKFGGTGFCVSYEFAPGHGGAYLVTARHVAEDLSGPFVIGLNNKDGSMRIQDIDEAKWQFHPNPNIDLAVAPMFQFGSSSDLMLLPHFLIANHDDSTWSDRFGIGDLVHAIGLYRLSPGKGKITPIAHTGHIAMMPDEDIPVLNRTSQKIVRFKGFVIEAQTLDGLSGAPVFVRPNVTVLGLARPFVAYSDEIALLGIWSSSWDGPSGEILSNQLGRQTKVPVGMGVVTPGKYLLEILNGEVFSKDRQVSLEKHQNHNAAAMD
jgi:hypothetical protein